MKGELKMLNLCADSVTQSTTENHSVGSGVIPASALHFRTNRKDDAFDLVKKYHYSHRIPSNIQFIGTLHLDGGLFGNLGEPVAAIIWTIPPTRWSEPVLELSRLVRKEGVRLPLSMLISLSLARLKARGNDLVVSFADTQQNHHGGIYQSCGWNYHGQRKSSMDGILINGKFVPGRNCNSVYGTRSPEKLKSLLPSQTIEPHFDDGKHLYWKAIGKKGQAKAIRLKLENNPYPKPDLNNQKGFDTPTR